MSRSAGWNLTLAAMSGLAAVFWHPEDRYAHLKHQIWSMFGADALLSLGCLFFSAAVATRSLRRELACLFEHPAPWKQKWKRHLGRISGFAAVILFPALVLGFPALVVISVFTLMQGRIWMIKRRRVIDERMCRM